MLGPRPRGTTLSWLRPGEAESADHGPECGRRSPTTSATPSWPPLHAASAPKLLFLLTDSDNPSPQLLGRLPDRLRGASHPPPHLLRLLLRLIRSTPHPPPSSLPRMPCWGALDDGVCVCIYLCVS